jgi:3-oxoadipate enol-lactonase
VRPRVVRVSSQRLETSSGITLAYDVHGRQDAPAMALLHALGETRHSWSGVVPRLAQHFRVTAFDLRGHGESDWPGDYSLGLMAFDIRDAIRQLDLDDITLVGHSMGAMVCYRLAVEDADTITRLVVEDAPPPYERDQPVPVMQEQPVDYDWDVVPAIVEEVNRGDPATWDALSRITAPTLVIGGGDTSHIPQDKLAEVATRIGTAELRTIPVGHHVHEEAPEQFLDAVLGWLL